MLDKLNGWQTVAALAVVAAVPLALVLTHQTSALGGVFTALGITATSVLKAHRFGDGS